MTNLPVIVWKGVSVMSHKLKWTMAADWRSGQYSKRTKFLFRWKGLFDERSWHHWWKRVQIHFPYHKRKISTWLLHEGGVWAKTWPCFRCVQLHDEIDVQEIIWAPKGVVWKKGASVHGVMLLYREEEEEGPILTAWVSWYVQWNGRHTKLVF